MDPSEKKTLVSRDRVDANTTHQTTVDNMGETLSSLTDLTRMAAGNEGEIFRQWKAIVEKSLSTATKLSERLNNFVAWNDNLRARLTGVGRLFEILTGTYTFEMIVAENGGQVSYDEGQNYLEKLRAATTAINITIDGTLSSILYNGLPATFHTSPVPQPGLMWKLLRDRLTGNTRGTAVSTAQKVLRLKLDRGESINVMASRLTGIMSQLETLGVLPLPSFWKYVIVYNAIESSQVRTSLIPFCHENSLRKMLIHLMWRSF